MGNRGPAAKQMNIMITGGTGSLGSALVRHFTQSDSNYVTVVSRDPHKQAGLKKKYPKVKCVLADVADMSCWELASAMKGIDTVVHCAALKRVEFGETDPIEYTRVNVLGTANVARIARDYEVERAIFVSTDKASGAHNTYGKTKALAEDIWLSMGSGFRAIRYGNVLDSAGSVWHLWKEARAQGKPLIVRHPSPTRFILGLCDAVKLIEKMTVIEDGLYVPYGLDAFCLDDMAFAMSLNVVKEPLWKGEKQHEVLISEHERAIEWGLGLWRVTKGNGQMMEDGERDVFDSGRTGHRISGSEVVRRLEEWSK
jgi:UDP-N-acetylglucosamine 4,6-dehydratase